MVSGIYKVVVFCKLREEASHCQWTGTDQATCIGIVSDEKTTGCLRPLSDSDKQCSFVVCCSPR